MNAADRRVLTIIVGPTDHGVVAHAVAVAAATGSQVLRLHGVDDVDRAIDDGTVASSTAAARVVQLHFTDRLFGSESGSAAARFLRLAQRCRCPTVVSLHDVPFDDGTAHSGARSTAYRIVATCAAVVVVASNVEALRFDMLDTGVPVRVIPLPVIDEVASPRPLSRALHSRPTLAVVGFVYPGKGHAELVDAAGRLRTRTHILALGRCSDGHEDMAAELDRHALENGVTFEITGHLDDRAMADAMAAADVPVVPAIRPSASASLHSWLGARRRPLVAANPYTVEVACAMPDAFVLYDASSETDLADRIDVALRHPDSTWRDGPLPEHASVGHVGSSHRSLYRILAESVSA